MLSKSLILFIFANMFNQAYGLEEITCPRWVPGTDEVMPYGMTLSPELELENKVRCIRQRVPENICKARTKAWVQKNLKLKQTTLVNNGGVAPVPVRDRMINIEP